MYILDTLSHLDCGSGCMGGNGDGGRLSPDMIGDFMRKLMKD